MTLNLTRKEMIERLIEDTYDGMDYKSLWYFFEHHQQLEFDDWTTEEIETEYKERFDEEDEE